MDRLGSNFVVPWPIPLSSLLRGRTSFHCNTHVWVAGASCQVLLTLAKALKTAASKRNCRPAAWSGWSSSHPASTSPTIGIRLGYCNENMAANTNKANDCNLTTVCESLYFRIALTSPKKKQQSAQNDPKRPKKTFRTNPWKKYMKYILTKQHVKCIQPPETWSASSKYSRAINHSGLFAIALTSWLSPGKAVGGWKAESEGTVSHDWPSLKFGVCIFLCAGA